MKNSITAFRKYLCTKYPNLKDIVRSFENCSKDDNTDRFLVQSQVLTINFDKLTEWMERGQGVKSADSMSFTDDHVYLIEFKSGDPTITERKLQKLADNVIGKINDSDDTLNEIYIEATIDKLDQVFCLVVDSTKMEITPLVSTLLKRSLVNNHNAKERQILERLLPDLKAGVHSPNHYSKINIWYSDIFDSYLEASGITNFEIT